MMTAMSRYVPPIEIVMHGLGVASLAADDDRITVSARFLRLLLAEFARSAAVDPDFYLATHAQAAAEIAAGKPPNAAEHFAIKGYFQGLMPAAPAFDPAWYVARYTDLAALDPDAARAHFLRAGLREGRAGTADGLIAEAWRNAAMASRAPAPGAALARATIAEAPVQVFSAPIVAVPPHGFAGGPVLDGDPRLARLRHTRAGHPVDRFRPGETYDARLPGTWIYAGPAYPHFGHSMAEMVHRILPGRRLFGAHGLLFVGTAGEKPLTGFDDLPPFLREILRLLDVSPDKACVLHRNHIVEQLHVVEAGSDYGGGPKPGYLDELAAFWRGRDAVPHAGGPMPGVPVYVSRTRLSPTGGLLGERYIEATLAQNGFAVFHPEQHPVAVQIETYRRASLLLFNEGSACHGIELLGTGMVAPSLLLSRRQDHAGIFRHVFTGRARSFHAFEDVTPIASPLKDPATGEPAAPSARRARRRCCPGALPRRTLRHDREPVRPACLPRRGDRRFQDLSRAAPGHLAAAAPGRRAGPGGGFHQRPGRGGA